MKLTKKSTYPSYAADMTDDVVLRNTNGQVLYQTHPFDIGSITNTKKKWWKDNITYGDVLLQGQQPLRPLYYKVNESKIPATLRMGINK